MISPNWLSPKSRNPASGMHVQIFIQYHVQMKYSLDRLQEQRRKMNCTKITFETHFNFFNTQVFFLLKQENCKMQKDYFHQKHLIMAFKSYQQYFHIVFQSLKRASLSLHNQILEVNPFRNFRLFISVLHCPFQYTFYMKMQ